MNTRRVDTIVVGAGLAGLIAARTVAAGGGTVTVVDPQPPGGRARTDDRGGHHWNRGPHALYRGAAAERLLRRFGAPLAGASPSSGFHGSLRGRVEPLPVGAASLVRSRLVNAKGKVALARSRARLMDADPAGLGSQTFAQWLEALRLPDDAAALQRMLARVGTYSCTPEIAAADMVVGQLQLSMRTGVLYVDGGWQVLVDALADGLDIRPEAAVAVGRDGEDVVASLFDAKAKYPAHWGWLGSLPDMVRLYNRYVRATRRDRGRGDTFVVRYDDLVERDRGMLDGLCRFLGVPPGGLDLARAASYRPEIVRAEEAWKVRSDAGVVDTRGQKFGRLFDRGQQDRIRRTLAPTADIRSG